MQRHLMVLEYDGGAFSGWQIQPSKRTVQEVVEQALSRVGGQPIQVVCAGRTDAGVHALSQVIHFESSAQRTPYNWIMGGNSNLPPDVRLLECRPVSGQFHARRSAIARHYRYTILNRRIPSALERGRVTLVPRTLDAPRMHEAAQAVIGHHDFSAFRAQGCQSKSPFRWVYLIDVLREGDRVHVDICANAYLHHMVRNLVGSLIEVGLGRRSTHWMADLLEGRNRAAAGATAPADGLYFAGILYPSSVGLARDALFDRLPESLTRFEPACHAVDVSLNENSR